MATVSFGELLKALRISRGYGLRQFAEMIGQLPSNVSAIEHGRRLPWKSLEILRRAADALALVEGSPQWDRFFSAARPGMPAPDIERFTKSEIFPVLCRTVNDARLTEQELKHLVEHIKAQRRLKTNDNN
jgi:transcriptional regulator with XRE-family HTH domain